MTTKPFALRLRELREAEGISRYRLAKETGLSQSYLGELERGLNEPSLRVAQRLAEYFRQPMTVWG